MRVVPGEMGLRRNEGLWNEAGTGRLNVPVGMRVVVEVVWSGRQLGGRAMEWAQVSSWNERADCALLRYTAVEL